VGIKKPKIQIVQYYMSLWYGFATGPVDKILAIYVDEKEIWSGELAESGVIKVNKKDLFGGPKKEGGVAGLVTYLDGRSSQTIPEYLANKLGRTEATCPAHRGIASLFFTGHTEASSTSGQVTFPKWLLLNCIEDLIEEDGNGRQKARA